MAVSFMPAVNLQRQLRTDIVPVSPPPLARTAISSEIASTVKDSLQDVVQDRPALGTHTFDFPLRDRQPYHAPDAKSSVKLPWTHTMNH